MPTKELEWNNKSTEVGIVTGHRPDNATKWITGRGGVVDSVAARAEVGLRHGAVAVGVDEVGAPEVDLVDEPLRAAGVDELTGCIVLDGLDAVLGQLRRLAFQGQGGQILAKANRQKTSNTDH